MGLFSNKITREELKPGDHIYSWRARALHIYAHHGIYAGDDKVIHFTKGAGRFSSFSSPKGARCQKCGDQSMLTGVIESCLDCFLSGGDLHLYQYGVTTAHFLVQARGGTCTLATPDPPDCVLHRSKYLLENGFGLYHIFKNNCEDFAIYCKTGLLEKSNLGRSGQVGSLHAAARSVSSLDTKASLFISYCQYRLAADVKWDP